MIYVHPRGQVKTKESRGSSPPIRQHSSSLNINVSIGLLYIPWTNSEANHRKGSTGTGISTSGLVTHGCAMTCAKVRRSWGLSWSMLCIKSPASSDNWIPQLFNCFIRRPVTMSSKRWSVRLAWSYGGNPVNIMYKITPAAHRSIANPSNGSVFRNTSGDLQIGNSEKESHMRWNQNST